MVQVVETCFVAPSDETPRGGLWLSPLDVDMASRGHTPTVYFYRCRRLGADDDDDDFFDLGRLKEAMGKALVAFYPLAGRLTADGDGRPEIDCNAEGALFVVARSELTVDEFSDVKPSPELRRLFVPRVEPPSILLAIQVTFLKCGGVALGTALHHAAIDASSAFHFFQTWSTFSRDGATAVVDMPCHDRTLLRARSPPIVHQDTFSTFCPKLKLADSNSDDPATAPIFIREVFDISKDQLANLKELCGSASTFCVLSAHIWRCVCMARRLRPDATTRLAFPANVRHRVKPPLPSRYFGNALICLCTVATVREITFEPLASVVGRIKGAIDRMDDELVRSAVDYFALAERVQHVVAPPRPSSGGGGFAETELMTSSWMGMPVYDADFGWGKPQVMSRADFRGGVAWLTNGGPADGGSSAVRVLMCLEAQNMKEFERLLYAKFVPS